MPKLTVLTGEYVGKRCVEIVLCCYFVIKNMALDILEF